LACRELPGWRLASGDVAGGRLACGELVGGRAGVAVIGRREMAPVAVLAVSRAAAVAVPQQRHVTADTVHSRVSQPRRAVGDLMPGRAEQAAGLGLDRPGGLLEGRAFLGCLRSLDDLVIPLAARAGTSDEADRQPGRET